jgi:hypothetical protein
MKGIINTFTIGAGDSFVKQASAYLHGAEKSL